MSKKGQITIFIVLGFFMVLIFLIVFSFKANLISKESNLNSNQRGALIQKSKTVKNYIESLLKENLNYESKLAMAYSGYSFGNDESVDLKYKCKPDDFGLCEHLFITKIPFMGYSKNVPDLKDLEKSLNLKLSRSFKRDFDLTKFFSESEIQLGNPVFKTNILENKIVSVLDYPIIIGSGENEVKVNEFSAEVNSDFGSIYSEINDSLIKFMMDHENLEDYNSDLKISSKYNLIYGFSFINVNNKFFFKIQKQVEGENY